MEELRDGVSCQVQVEQINPNLFCVYVWYWDEHGATDKEMTDYTKGDSIILYFTITRWNLWLYNATQHPK